MKAPLTIVARAPAPAAANPPAPTAIPAVKAPPRPDHTKLQSALIASLVLLACTLTAWNLFVRLPQMSLVERVHARQLPGLQPSAAQAAGRLSAEEVQRRVEKVRERMLPGRKALVPLLAELERMARTEGWRMDAAMKPPVGAPAGVENVLRYPVAIHLQNQADPGSGPPAFVRLASWLRRLSLLGQRVEVASLSVQSTPSGISAADLELHFWSLNPDAKVAAK
jgi:hypothetical protein